MKTFLISLMGALIIILAARTYATEKGNQTMTNAKYENATFAGGCFWCMQPPYDKTEGVVDTIVGYTDGETENPTYEEVSSGSTGHTEAIQVTYDPARVSYEELVNIFWRNIDPTTENGQFADIGTQYRTGIYYHNDEQKRIAEASKKALEDSGKYSEPIVVEIRPASKFWKAEEYHQKYYQKASTHYKMYSIGSGRADYIKDTWGEEKK